MFPIDMTITRAETPEPMSPFMVFPVRAEPYFKAAMQDGCDPYNTVDRAEELLFIDMEVADGVP
jgi:hypothetical protein